MEYKINKKDLEEDYVAERIPLSFFKDTKNISEKVCLPCSPYDD
jgi:hypothetical protein